MKTITLMLALAASLVFAASASAQQKPQIKLDPDQIKRAAEFAKRYQALTSNPETLAAMKRLAETMKARRATQ